MWRRIAMCKRLCNSLLTWFDGAFHYGIHFDYIHIYHCIAWRPIATSITAVEPSARGGTAGPHASGAT
ncbi:hypothetical protein EVAR_61763_1 [Eumeta japonica]|uniref:Uncharacterized protein n=1 Tax=Eumeta variegata TaxID=151549 RepID=A0A4C1ZAA5_EUMVA|nr:hypothetical protein EVAR_61763_1 [Eumeta japonica]